MYNNGTYVDHVDPGHIAEPYHLPGYGGHVPSMRERNGGTFGRLTRDAMEDPCVAQAPISILRSPPPRCPSCPPSISMSPSQEMDCQMNGYFRTPLLPDEIGCCSAPAQHPTILKPQPMHGCIWECCDPRAQYLNRSPHACPSKPEPDSEIYRSCESLGSSYAGHVPGFTYRSSGRTFCDATRGTNKDREGATKYLYEGSTFY